MSFPARVTVFGWRALTALGLASCAGAPPPAHEAPREAPLTPSSAPPSEPEPEPHARYTLTPARRHGRPVPGVVFRGTRFAMVEGRLHSVPPDSRGEVHSFTEIPQHLGGGFLFDDGARLHRSRSFTAKLEPLADAGSGMKSIQFGAGFFLVESNGERQCFDLQEGKRRPLPTPGLVQVASHGNGWTLGLTSRGEALITRDGQAWQDVSQRLPGRVTGLEQRESEAAFAFATGEVLAPNAEGTLERIGPRPPRSMDARWPLDESPLERAVKRGVPIGRTKAAVDAQGAVAIVDLVSGELDSVTTVLAPGSSDCQLVEASPEPLLVCAGPSLSVIGRPLSAPTVERTFPRGTRASHGAGTLVFDHACSPQSVRGLACLRRSDGSYHAIDLRSELDQLRATGVTEGPPQPTLVWFPAEQSALLYVMGPPSAFVDAKTGARIDIPSEHDAEIRSRLQYRPGLVATNAVATSGQRILLRGHHSRGVFKVLADGQLEPPSVSFHTVMGSGARALGSDGRDALFESLDYGASWQQVETGPGPLRPEACSAVGCGTSAWLRIGWGGRPPSARASARRDAPPLPVVPRSLPVLSCRELGAPRFASVFASEDGKRGEGFGASHVALFTGSAQFTRVLGHWRYGDYELGLFALVHARTPLLSETPEGAPFLSKSEAARTKSIFYVQPFDPAGRPHTARISWRQQAEAARQAAGDPPDFDPSDQEELETVVVSHSTEANAASLSLREPGVGSLLWLDGSRARAASLGPVDSRLVARAGVSDGASMVLLLSSGMNENRVVRIGRAELETLSDPPGTPSSLGLHQSGELSVYYDPGSGQPPSDEDPAWLLRRGAFRPLPPWSTLRTADAPECRASDGDVRLVLRPERGWLELELPSVGYDDAVRERPMLAQVRVDERRFCLEAVELGMSPVMIQGSLQFPVRLIARFGKTNSAGKLGIDQGVEYRQSASCVLER